MNMFARFDENPAMALRVIKETKRLELLRKKHYIKSHLELQREITLIELAPSPYARFTLCSRQPRQSR